MKRYSLPWTKIKKVRMKIKEVIKVGNATQLETARMCMAEAIKLGERPIVIEYVNGYEPEPMKHERNPFEGCPEQFK